VPFVAAAYLDADDEWAFWTPRGYYAASANGDRLFGWLVNRGIDRLPRFFRANQFRRKLERPDVVSRILIEGSLDAALRAAGRAVPESSAIVLPQQIASAPEVRLIPPAAKPDGPAGRLVVAAEVDVPAGAEVDRVRFFGNGVPAVSPPRLVAEVAAADGESRRLRYEAELLLPEQDRHLVNVFAATRSGAADADELKVTVEDLPLRTRDPRIFIITAGVDRYANAEQWQRSGLGFDDLRFAVKDAGSIRDALAKGRLGLYDQGADHFLADEQMTRSGWKHTVRSMLESIKSQIEPDDLLVLFLAGHGLTDVEAEGAYAYLCHDAALRVTAADDQVVPTGEGAIGWTDLAELADLPCRKFALVDTCHSGALGPAARSTTIREFQENMIVVLAAAADDQSSLESDDWGHGLFTKVLLEGLSGKADVRGGRPADQRASSQAAGLKDGIVSLDELIDYVRVHVPRIAGENGRVQTPTVSPVDLLDFVRPPLAKIAELP
jgi:hypothetical protein